jgi:hypothetical protein
MHQQALRQPAIFAQESHRFGRALPQGDSHWLSANV